jgi:hypothetical protein
MLVAAVVVVTTMQPLVQEVVEVAARVGYFQAAVEQRAFLEQLIEVVVVEELDQMGQE